VRAKAGDFRYWHKADMLNALTNVWGKADIDQPLLTNLDGLVGSRTNSLTMF
jgi:hypothetical protein